MTRNLGPLSYHMTKAPTPVNRHPWLPSNGFDQMKATRHKYVKAVETSVPGPIEGVWEDVWQYVYACEETGAERVWGYASRDLSDYPKDN